MNEKKRRKKVMKKDVVPSYIESSGRYLRNPIIDHIAYLKSVNCTSFIGSKYIEIRVDGENVSLCKRR